MARAIWKGSISFGLVTIPVGLFSAESPDEISFRQLDKNNLSQIGYKKYNKQTGKEVDSADIVKGYEYEDERYVLISDEDLRRANPEKSQTVEITDFVDLADIRPVFYDKPYYLGPLKKNQSKAYALLREALKRSGKVGIARVVIRTREYLAAVVPQDSVLVLEILRYPHEIRSFEDLDLPGEDLRELGVTEKELEMANVLIEGMTSEWDPSKYHDSYRDDLMSLIQRKVESGQTEVIDETPAPEVAPRADVIDIMSLLKKSVEATSRERADADRGDRADSAPAPAASRPKSAGAKPAAVKAVAKAPAKPAAPSKPAAPAVSKPKGTSAERPKPRQRKTA